MRTDYIDDEIIALTCVSAPHLIYHLSPFRLHSLICGMSFCPGSRKAVQMLKDCTQNWKNISHFPRKANQVSRVSC